MVKAPFPSAPPFPSEEQRHPPLLPLLCASAWGDDAYGIWLEVEIAGVTQCFRWIEPGEFWMGSPDGEPERHKSEGPRHGVRLTAGYWLADTACTQALWQAVMGNNPSHFTDDPLKPVERVLWDEVSAFLQRVEEMLLAVEVRLPTEAEWEYACRAGSETPFNVGATLSPTQANFNGNYPYAGAKKGLYRAQTLPVKSFLPNDWGLYQMHGNVWEWCADGQRAYDGLVHENPRGPEGGGAPRVVRGGSWNFGARWLRSAYRSRRHRDERYDLRGFRFSLRSTTQAVGAEPLPQGERVTRDA